MEENTVLYKSKQFALRVINLYRYLTKEQSEFILSKQVLRSGTSIGANIREADCAQSKADFFAKMYVAYKEASETKYWLELLHESGYIGDREFDSVYDDCNEIYMMLSAITKKQKED